MIQWLKQQLTLQMVLTVCVLFGTFTRAGAGWAYGMASTASDNTRAIAELVTLTQQQGGRIEAVALRVESLEMLRVGLNDEVSKTFPRRNELEPRLRNIEENIAEQNRLLRRLQENYGFRKP